MKYTYVPTYIIRLKHECPDLGRSLGVVPITDINFFTLPFFFTNSL